MSLTSEGEQLIIHIDSQVNKILSESIDNAELIFLLTNVMRDLRKLMDSATQDEMEMYCQKYDGFCLFMKLLEELALEICKNRNFSPTYH